MSGYSPDIKVPKRELTEGQQKILDTIWDFGGDAVAAARAAGYSNPYAARDSVADELVELAKKAMASLAPKSVHVMGQVLDSKGDVKQASEKLKAAQLILDRVYPKVEQLDVNTNSRQAIFILPDKKPVDEQPEEVSD